MATITKKGTATATPTASSISFSGTTQKSGTISWTTPTLPDNATILSCTLTGTMTGNTSFYGSVTLTVNGTTVTSGTAFSIDLGTKNTTSSVIATAKGSSFWASGTATFSNLLYTVEYEYTETVKDPVKDPIKENKRMMINNTNVKKMYVGENVVYKAYLGNMQIF